jgi:DNA-binding beta-propeller fold protein YncE
MTNKPTRELRGSFLLAAMLGVAGCAGAGSPPPSSGGPAPGFVHLGTPVASYIGGHTPLVRRSVRTSYATNKTLVFESDQAGNGVNIFELGSMPKNLGDIASITVAAGCPYGLAMDKEDTLYVADNCSGNDVEEYPKGSTKESVAITDGISNPLGLAIDSNQTLYVSGYPGAITEYAHGTTTPSKTITGQGLEEPFGLALDKANNLYIADYGALSIFEIKHGSSTVTNLGLQDVEEPLGVAVDHKTGYLWVTDGKGDKIDVFKPGETTPFEKIAGNGDPYAISVDNKGKRDGTVVEADVTSKAIYGYKRGQYTSYFTQTTGIAVPTGLLVTKP